MSEELQNTMEGRARRRASPAGMRTRPVRVEPEPPLTKKNELGTMRVAVVYYLCRNHQLEHPHFMEVPLASPKGLYLRDVISRLDTLRGNGMAAKYSWSCKRRYKNGFVWHDLSEGDLLLPAQGTEYVLKGSELQLDQSKSPLPPSLPGHQQNSSTSNGKVQLHKPPCQQQSPSSPRSNQGWPSTSPCPDPAVPVVRESVPPPAAIVSAILKAVPSPAQPTLLSSPSASTIGYDERCRMPHLGSSSNSSPTTSTLSSGASSPGINNPAAAHEVATQTDDKARGNDTKLQQRQDTAEVTPERPEVAVECHLKHRSEGEHPSSRRSGTLQSLIRAEAVGRRRGLLEEDGRTATMGSVSGSLRPANLLMRLMACGPNNPGFGLVQTSYKPRFTRLEYLSASPELTPLGALKPGTSSVSTARASETENCTGSLVDGVAGRLEHSSSSHGHQDGVCDEASWSKGDSGNPSRSTSKRMSDPSSSGKVPASRAVWFHNEKEKMVEMEERRQRGLLQELGVIIH